MQAKKVFSTKDTFTKKLPSDTVGAVALDKDGTIAAGTSTGGTPNKYPGRIGDSPLIGSGTYADSAVGGVSCTGWGEAIIKVALAKTVIDRMEINGDNPEKAAAAGIEALKNKADGFGGVIVVNRSGTVSIAYNTPRMARAYRTSDMTEGIVEV
jgi:beta-aspartyl-peptidase (threonine type)